MKRNFAELTLTTADTEYSIAIPGCRGLRFQVDPGTAASPNSAAELRYCETAGLVAAKTPPYLTIASGTVFSDPAMSRGLELDATTLYFASSMMPTPPKRAPQAWMMEELSKLFATIDCLPGEVAGVPARLWWKAVLLSIYYTAERIGALMSLKYEHINFDMATMYVPAEFRKGKRSDKIFSLPPVIIESLRALGQRPDSDPLFPWNLTTCMLFKKLKTIHRRAGLPTDRRSMFHRMRRTAASWYKAKGGDPTQLLDHADAKTTARYLDLRICQTESPAKLLDDPTAKTGGAE
jgi:integrase